MAVEDFAFARGNRAHMMGGIGYLIRYLLWKKGVPFVVVGTKQLKKFATGHGNSQGKQTVIREVFRKWNLEIDDDNEADAAVLAHVAMCLVGAEAPTCVYQRVVLTTLTENKTKTKKKKKAA